jgi:membrane protease YdiL (CAAX protease family)
VHASEETAPATQPVNSFVPFAPEVDPDNPPWGLGLAVLTWFLSVVLLFLVPQIISLPYLIYHYEDTRNLTREILLADKQFIFLSLLGVIFVHILTIALVWAVVTRLGRYPFQSVIGWSWPPRFGLWTSAGLGVILFAIGGLIAWRFGGEPTDIDKIVMSSRLNACTTAFLATLTAPLVEELVYRGVLFAAVRRAIGMVSSVLIVMGLFTVVHVYQYWPNFGVLTAILLLSFMITLVRAHTGRLLPCYVIHLVFNGIQSLIIIVSPYLPNIDKMLQRRTTGELLLRFLIFHF